MHLFSRSLLAFAVLGSVAFQCHRDKDSEAVITQTVDKTVTAGSTFTVALPGDADDVYTITTPAKLAAASSVATHTYTYTAGTVAGEDQVILTATEQSQGHHGGNCSGMSHNGETVAVVTVNIHIAADSTTTTRVGG